ncbi:hypothetical protein K466DRAFT_533441 [Polyporus arcularius HHB13444]|uniref:Uncharacterized protein n=1 Tax=Polyporus arcularius HHB13444 TaxID=1314778 RepID=A0A5C3NVB4_9APHY|nr:hypothetical protein K466DRAFT_533441 [Polyporus arcularius HHB13444]
MLRDDSSDDEINAVEPGQSESSSICRSLAQILEEGQNVTGAFSYMRTHPVAPNPGLHVNGLGTLGLPLSLREAAAIKACAQFAASSSTLEDASASGRHCWEISANNVRFENGGWTAFIDDTLRQVCQAFAVDYKTSAPRSVLSKLALCEPGFSSSASVVHTSGSGAIATVVVVLPSKFTGGEIRLAHGDREEIYDCSTDSLANTTVLAWFGDCTREIQPLTEGFQLTLHYELLHTNEVPPPSLFDQDQTVSRLRDLFSTWNSEKGITDTPRKVVYLLKDKYTHDQLAHASLSGTDAQHVSLLNNVGKLHEFRIGLATLVCTERGAGELQREYYGDEDWIEGANDVTMVEVDDREIEIIRLVSLDGRLICTSLEHDLKREGIPTRMIKLITSERPDKQMYAYQNSEHMSYKRVFYRTVAVLWPQWAEFELVHGPGGFLDACKRLRACNTAQPTAEDAELVEAILARTEPSTSDAVMSSVCKVALMWGDLPLWLRTVKACNAERCISAMEEENIHRAVSAFGFQPLQECLQQALQRDPSDVDTLQFLEDFRDWVSEQESSELSAIVVPWIAARRKERIDGLKGPAEVEYEALVELVLQHGDPEELERKVLPYIISSASDLVIVKCVELLSGERCNSVTVGACTRMIGELLTTVSSKVDYRPLLNSLHVLDNEDRLELLQLYIKGCVVAKRNDLLSDVWPRLKDFAGLSNSEISSHTEYTLFPLISDVAEAASDVYASEVSSLIETTVSHWLDTLGTPDVPKLAENMVLVMLEAISASKQTSLLDTRIIPIFEAEANDKQLRLLLDGLRASRSILGPIPDTVTLSLLKKWFATTQQPLNSTEAVAYIVSFDMPEACSLLFQPLLNPPVLDKSYVQTQLAILLRSICSSLATHKLSAKSPNFAPTLRAIMRHWTEKVMVPRPTDEAFRPLTALADWKCSCKHCKAARDFLLHTSEEVWTGRIGKQNRDHVIAHLGKHARFAADWKALQSRGNGEPHGVEVRKDGRIADALQWSRNRLIGLELLKAISQDEAELQTVLEEDYPSILASLQEPIAPASTASTVPRAQNVRVAQTATAPGMLPDVYMFCEPKPQGAPSRSGEQRGVRQGDAIAGPPAKRRKTTYDEKDVIDISY